MTVGFELLAFAMHRAKGPSQTICQSVSLSGPISNSLLAGVQLKVDVINGANAEWLLFSFSEQIINQCGLFLAF